ncbi:MAG: efflux RND transporter permease subunit [bacterium]|nr:efflux RND transporter permease subunit [bacterium]
MKKIVTYFAERSLLVNLFTVALLITGIVFIANAKREAFPNIDFDYVLIRTVYPGATAEDIEKHITIPLEKELREVDGLKELSSYSIEAISVIAIQLDPDLDNKDKTINDIKNAVDKAADIPEESEDPIIEEISMKMSPVLEISIINKNGIKNDKDEFELRKYAKMLENRLLEVKGVAKVKKIGYREREIIVEVNPRLLDVYHVAINEVILALSLKNINFPGGIVKSPKGEIVIRTIGEVRNAKEVKDILIRANDTGNLVRIRDVAKVKDSFESERYINKTKSRKSIMLTVLKKESVDIITLVEKLNAETTRFKGILPRNYELFTFNDMSFLVKRRLQVLINNGIVGFILVILSLLISLGWRISLVTALGIPIAFFGTFIWMAHQDISINLMSMFGLIMVLGMIVDDAIIVAENVYRHLEDGEDVKKAVIDGTTEVITPVLGTVLTTIAAFSPLMFMSGIMGKFMWTLPAIVSVALVASWLECMFILPSHIEDVERRKKSSSSKIKKERKLLKFFQTQYKNILRGIIRFRYLFIFFIFLVFTGTILFAKYNVKFILFPKGAIEIAVIRAEAPIGTTVKKMSKQLGKIERVLGELPEKELDIFTTRAGIIEEAPGDPNTKRGSNYGIIMVYLTPSQERERTAIEIIDGVREKCAPFAKEFDKLEFKFVEHGPPVGKAINVTIKGDNFATLETIAKKYKDHLSKIKGLKDVKDNFEKGKDELRVFVREKPAAVTGITVFDIATTIRSCYEGTVSTTIKKTDEEIDIRVIFPEKMRESLGSMKTIKIANKMGNLVPLSSVARFERTKGIPLINRKGWRRVISVTADIDEHAKGISSLSINNAMIKKFAHIEKSYPGYTVSYEGEFKDTEESMADLMRSFLIAALIIYIILVSLFKSLGHPAIIMGVIPLTSIGVIWAFFFHGMSLSFMATMGIVGLTGVVINDSIVLVDFITKARKRGLSPEEASLHAGVTRLRPVFLTTITTFFGLVPTAYGIGGFDPFLKPMAIALSWGLIFGTLITLLVIPTIYLVFSDINRLFQRIKNKMGTSTGMDLL